MESAYINKGGCQWTFKMKFEFDKKELEVVANFGKIGVFTEKATKLLEAKAIGSDQQRYDPIPSQRRNEYDDT